jgi:hypothetical protein
MDDLSKLASDLRPAADNLRANYKLTSSDYGLGVIFFRNAANSFDAAAQQFADAQSPGKVPKRKIQLGDHIRHHAPWLPGHARFVDRLQNALGWQCFYAFNEATFRPGGMLGRASEHEAVVIRDLMLPQLMSGEIEG